ncbi:MAG: cell division protein ZapB [Treponema sp.]|nr:cell division protein ZapB [Treponema sp.]
MISLDQVLLLEEKVESAVQKIAQLNQENDALRMKCSELTKALSEKTEQLSSFSSDQNKIEEGILKALERLNSVEHSVLKAAALNQQIQTSAANINTAQNLSVVQSATLAQAVASVTPAPAETSAGNLQTSTAQDAVENNTGNTVNETVIPESQPAPAVNNISEDNSSQEPNNTEKSDKDNGQFYIF